MKKARKPIQLSLMKNEKSAYGGDLRNTRAGRSTARPLSTRETMHLVLRSTQAKGEWSFRKPKNDSSLRKIVAKHSIRYGVRVLSMANVGNHLHMQLKLSNRFTYNAFIRAVTGAIAQAVTRQTRWTAGPKVALKFWDYRPFTRIVKGFSGYLRLKDYIRINEIEGFGHHRTEARDLLSVEKVFERDPRP